MARISYNRFGGSTPRLAPHLAGDAAAGDALDCKLWHGTLQSWREPLQVHTPADDTLTVYLYGCCWLEFPTCVGIAEGPVTCPKIFTTGDQEWPAIMEFDDDCNPTIRRLGLPCPTTAPSTVVGEENDSAPKDTEGRSYAYQYVNSAGERGALSRGSPVEMVRDGQTVVVSGWDIPDSSWDVTHVRIYRTVSGFKTGNEIGNTLDTSWMFVAEVEIDAPSYSDSLWNEELEDAIEEDIADPPPEDLRGIIHIESMNALAGFVGNRVYFSENNTYHHWPYYHDLDDNVCALSESNGVVYAITDGAPYAIAGVADCQNAGCREALRLPVKYPMVGCGNRRVAKLPQGVVYPTHDGLVALSGNGMPQLFTYPLYAPDDWHQLFPETVIPIVHTGQLFVFSRGSAFVMRLANGPEQGWPLDSHSRLSDTGVIDAFVTRNGDFMIVKEDGVWQWDRGAALRPHQWTSPTTVALPPLGFALGYTYLQNGAEHVTIEATGIRSRVEYDQDLVSEQIFTLPRWMFGTQWQITLEGTATVSLFSIATSAEEI